MKKLIALVLALIMVLSLSTVAFASEKPPVTQSRALVTDILAALGINAHYWKDSEIVAAYDNLLVSGTKYAGELKARVTIAITEKITAVCKTLHTALVHFDSNAVNNINNYYSNINHNVANFAICATKKAAEIIRYVYGVGQDYLQPELDWVDSWKN